MSGCSRLVLSDNIKTGYVRSSFCPPLAARRSRCVSWRRFVADILALQKETEGYREIYQG